MRRPPRTRQTGASAVEFVIGFPVFIFFLLATLQMALLYQAKSVLDMATLAAARAGAVNNMDRGKIRQALALGLVPLANRGTDVGALTTAYARVFAESQLFTEIEILNPTPQSFNDHAYNDTIKGRTRRAIPNDNLTYRPTTVGGSSQQNVQDANILRIRVSYGHPINVPLMRDFFQSARYLIYGVPRNPAWVAAGRLSLESVATVRMQSPAVQ